MTDKELKKKIDDYFENTTEEQMHKDLKKFYSVDSSIDSRKETLDEILGLEKRSKPKHTYFPTGPATKISVPDTLQGTTLRVEAIWFSKAIRFSLPKRPEKLKEWLGAIWNLDIFIGPVPILKTICFINLIGIII